jgi:cellulose biosynthesis protein BcsQ
MASIGYRVVLVDADPQGSLTHMAGFKREPRFYDLIERDAPFGECLREIDPVIYRPTVPGGRLMLLPGNAETDNINVQRHARRLRDKLRALENDADIIIIDTNPSPSKLHVGAYLATDYIVYPTIPEDMPLVGLQDSIDFTTGANDLRIDLGYRTIQAAGIVPNLVRKVTLQHQHYLNEMRKEWGAYVWPEVSNLTAWSEASAKHVPVYVYEPFGQAAEQMFEIGKRMEKILVHEQEVI